MRASPILSLWAMWAIAAVLAGPPQSAPPQCHTNRCLRAFERQTLQPEASSYCSRFLGTVIEPVVVTEVAQTTTTFTFANATITQAEATTTLTEYVYTTRAGPEGLSSLPYSLTSLNRNKAWTTTITTGLDKRDEAFPAYANRCPGYGTRDQADRVSSACSCLIVNTPPVTTTTTTQTHTAKAPAITPVGFRCAITTLSLLYGE